MRSLLLTSRKVDSKKYSFSDIVVLDDGLKTTIHVVRYRLDGFIPKVISFAEPTVLLDWCEKYSIREAMVGGFFLRAYERLLGEIWISGTKQSSVAVETPWEGVRACMYVPDGETVHLGFRNIFPAEPTGDLLQAGPLLIKDGQMLPESSYQYEGISGGSSQFDSDISKGRYPRAAIGVDDKYIWSIVCDGRSNTDAGLTLSELAHVMKELGTKDALNLDGGGSATQISEGIMRNKPRGGGIEYNRGREMFSAIIFEEVIKR